MTSFLWVQIAHKVAKTRLHAVSRLKELSMKELQNSSSEDTVGRAGPEVRHASCTIGHVKNRWEQSSISPSHKGQFVIAPGTKQWRMALVIRRRRTSSQPKIRIFSGRHCLHITRHRRTRAAASEGSCPRRRRYTAVYNCGVATIVLIVVSNLSPASSPLLLPAPYISFHLPPLDQG